MADLVRDDCPTEFDGERSAVDRQQFPFLAEKVKEFIGKKGNRYFRLLYQFHGHIPLVVRLNEKRKFLPVHTVHLNEGMQIRNMLRGLEQCKGWDDHDFDNNWIELTCMAIDREYDPKPYELSEEDKKRFQSSTE